MSSLGARRRTLHVSARQFRASPIGAGLAARPPVLLRTVTVWALLAASVPSLLAQDTRDDGIKALLRGDYAEAVRILGPLAEDARPGDHTAQFLMALLYDSGKGVAPNSIRACALAAAAASSGGPFTQQATQLARQLREENEGTARWCGGDAWRSIAPPSRLMTRIGATASFASDGVIAIARGDYGAAVQHLRVLGEGDFSTDSGAQFFMAVLYQSGHGVKADPLRACALYHRASSADASPFGVEAHRLMKALWRAHDNEWLQRCQTLGNVGISQLREPAVIDLGPGHSVDWDETGARITYQEKVTRVNLWTRGKGSIPLPPRHTRLITGAARETRDFIELGVWHPSGSLWKLSWYLTEVNGAELRIVGSYAGLVTERDSPSVDRPLDLRTIVALGVNEAGSAEWSSLVSGRPGGEIVESAGDRRRRSEEEAMHRETLARIDWSRTLDVSRPPSFEYLPAEGCTLLSLTAFAPDRAEAIRVIVDRKGLGLANTPRVVDLSRERRVAVTLHVYDRSLRESPFCTERRQSTTEQIWRAVSGTITIETTATGVARHPAQYRATIRLERAQFVNDAGTRVSQPAPVVLSALVGAPWRYRH